MIVLGILVAVYHIFSVFLGTSGSSSCSGGGSSISTMSHVSVQGMNSIGHFYVCFPPLSSFPRLVVVVLLQACMVVDALGPEARKVHVDEFCRKQLDPYVKQFPRGGEVSGGGGGGQKPLLAYHAPSPSTSNQCAWGDDNNDGGSGGGGGGGNFALVVIFIPPPPLFFLFFF